MLQIRCLILVCFLVVTANVNGQSDFFWSDKPLDEGAVNADFQIEMKPGNVGSLFLYYSTNGPLDSNLRMGAFLDVRASKSGVIRFLDAETFNFDIEVVGKNIGPRWHAFGNVGDASDDAVTRWGAFVSVMGSGILENHNGSSAFLDTGYDSGADAFLFGRIDFEVIGCGYGDVDIIVSANNGEIYNEPDCFDPPLEPVFGSATIIDLSGFLLGDINMDGVVNLLDVQPMVDLIADSGFQIEADINKDGDVNLLDVDGFVHVLLGSPPGPGDGNGDGGGGDGDCMIGDVNQDGVVNILDDGALVEAILSGEYQCEADINEDGIVNLLDMVCWIDSIFH